MRQLRQISIRLALTFKVSVLFSLVFLSSFAVYTYTRSSHAPVAHAITNSTLNFQGRLLSSSGSVVPDGNYNLEFKIYDGGTQGGPAGTGINNAGTLLWTETRDFPGTDDRVRVVNGYFSVNLGSVTAFPGSINWDQELWLTMNVGGSTTTPAWDGEMLAPTNKRTKLTGVPYAFESGSAKRLLDRQGSFTGALDFLSLTANRNITLPDASGSILLDSTGFANGGNNFTSGTAVLGTNNSNDLIFETNNSEALRIDQAGNVSIGTGVDGLETLDVDGGIRLGNTSNTNAGTMRWTGTDFEGYNGSGWVSLTSGGGGMTIIGNNSASFISGLQNLAGTANGTATGLLSVTGNTAFSVLPATGSGTFVAPADGSFVSCLVVGNANRTAGTATLRWRVNGASVGTGACVIDGTNVRTSATSVNPGTVTFNAGDTITVAFDTSGLTPAASTEYTVYWSVAYDYDPGAGLYFAQGGNSFGSTATLGTDDGFGLNFETNGLTRMAISSTGDITVNGLLNLSGGVDNNNGGITEAGSITGVGTNITATGGLTIASGGSGDLTLDSASNVLVLSDATIQRSAGGATTIDLFDGGNTTLSLTNSDGTAVAGLNVEGAISGNSISGDGSGLTSLNASNISTGTLDDLRLSSNVALLDADQIFTGAVTFDDGLVLENSTSTVAGAIRWTGTDFEGFDGASWMSFTTGGGGGGGSGQPPLYSDVKPTDEIITSNITPQNDDHLAFDMGANETWTFRFVVQATSPAAADLRFAVTAPSGAVCDVSVLDPEGAVTVSNLGCGVSSGLIVATLTADTYEVVGSIRNAGTAGEARLQWAQFVSDPGNTTVLEGSYVTANISGGGLVLLQGGNAFGSTVTIGATDSNGINFITNNTNALSIASTGDATFAGLASINGGLVVGNASNDTFTINSNSVTLNNGLNFDSNTFVIDSANNRVGINNATPNNVLNVNTEATADSLAQALIYTNGTANKGLVIQRTAGQTGNLFEAQDEDGNAIYAIRSTGRLFLGRSSFTNGSLALANSSNAFTAEFVSSALSADRTITLPDESGIVCLDTNNCDFIELASGTQQTDGTNNDVISIDKTSATGNLLTLERNGTGVVTIFNNGALELQLTDANAFSVLNAGGTSLFNVDTSANVVSIGGLTGDGTGVLFVLDEKNTAGDPTGINGATYYNSADGKTRCFENGQWTDCQTNVVLGETTLSVASGTISVALNQTYESLSCRVAIKSRSVASFPYLRFNNVSTGNQYSYNLYGITGTAVVDAQNVSQNQMQMTQATSNTPFSATIDITNFSDVRKTADWSGTGADVVTTNPNRFNGVGVYNLTAGSITSVQIVASAGTFAAGSHMYCEGRNVR